MKCLLCKKKIWFWQKDMWGDYHLSCYKSHLKKSFHEAHDELKRNITKELMDLDLRFPSKKLYEILEK